MDRLAGIAVVVLALAGGVVGPAAAQRTQEVRLEADQGKGEYRFSPKVVTADAGDVLVFLVADGAPHSIVFEGKALTTGSREALNAAMPRRSADLSSPLLIEKGAAYRMVVPALPPGTYQFFCLPHRAYDMRGELRVRGN